MAVSVSALENTVVMITSCTSVDHFSVVFRRASLCTPCSMSTLVLTEVCSRLLHELCSGLLHELCSCVVHLQPGRQAGVYDLQTTYISRQKMFPTQVNCTSNMTLWSYYAKYKGIWSKIQVIVNGISIYITRNRLELVYSLRKPWNTTVLEASLAC